MSIQLYLSEQQVNEERIFIRKNSENFKCLAGCDTIQEDKASLGLSLILNDVRKRGGKIYLSGLFFFINP